MKKSKKIMAVSMATAMTLGSMSTAFAINVDGVDYQGAQIGDKFYSLEYIVGNTDDFASIVATAGSNIILDLNGKSGNLADYLAANTTSDFDTWVTDPANQTEPNPATLVKADGTEEQIQEVITVVSASAIDATTIEVTFSNDETVQVTLDTPLVDGSNEVTFTYNEVEYTVTVEYAELQLTISIADEDNTLTADGADDTTVTVEVMRDGQRDQAFEGAVKFQSLKGATFAKETVVFDKGIASVQLTSMSSAVAIQDTIVATISDAPQDTDFVGTSIQANIAYIPEDGNQQTGEKVFLTYAESDRTSDIFVKFNKDIDFDKIYEDWKTTPAIIQVNDGSGLQNVKDLVKVNSNTIKLVLMEAQAVADNKQITVKATNSGIQGTLIDSEAKFNLVDNKSPEALSVSTPDYRTIVAKFTEPISKTTAEVIGNWVLNGHELTSSDISFVKVGRDVNDDKAVTQPDEIYTVDGEDYRNYVTIRLTSTGAAYLKKDAEGNPKMNLLQAYNMIDYAGLTDTTGQNKATTQEFTFMTPAAPEAPTAEVVMDSPEQYRVIFSTEVQTKAGGDLTKDHFEFKYQTKADAKNADGTIKYAGGIDTADSKGAFDDTFADAGNSDKVVVTKISDKEYLLELNRDWTRELDTDGNAINYYTPDNNHVKITVKNWSGDASREVLNFNDVAMADAHNQEFTLTLDDIEPVISNAEQVMDTDGTPLKKVKVTMSEPIQMVASDGSTEMTSLKTPSQAQGLDMPIPTYEFVSEDLKTTLEGQLVAGSLAKDDTEFEIEPKDPAKLTAGKWTVYVRSISDDIGNTSATEKYEVEIKATESEKGKAQIIWADAHDNADLDNDTNADSDVVHIQFGTEMSLDVLKSTIYTIDGNNLPTGVKITSQEVYYDSDNDGTVETTGDDLQGTLVTITLPHSFLGDTSDAVVNDIDSVDPDDVLNQDQPHILNISKGLTDAEGNTMISPTEVELTYTINGEADDIYHYDVYAPAAPAIGDPVEGDNIVNAAEATTVEVSGTTEADATVDVVFSDGTTQVSK